jgi:Holliday junction resolvase-like predicted endonuclease
MGKTQPETVIRKAVRDYLRFKGFAVFTVLQGLGAHRGISDLIVVRKEVTAFVEIKTATGKLSEWQEKFKFDVESHGGAYVVIRSVDEIIDWEKELS